MDFSQLILEYQFSTKNKEKGQIWWKNEAWNKPKYVKNVDSIESSFNRQDFIMNYSNKWEATYRWLRHNLVLVAQQKCD